MDMETKTSPCTSGASHGQPVIVDWDAITAATGRQAHNPRPPGSITSAEYAARSAISESTASRILARAYQAGRMTRGPYRDPARPTGLRYWYLPAQPT